MTTLRKNREARKVSLRKTAAVMGISPMYLSDLERGHRPLTPDLRRRHSAALRRITA